MVLVAAVLLPVAVSLLYTYAPTEYTFLPCLFYTFTGLHCPGCGATRASHSLLHGEFEQALAWNPLFVILLPAIAYVLFRSAWQMWTGGPMPGYRFPIWVGKILLATVFLYWIVRNIPVYPFTLLAPHSL